MKDYRLLTPGPVAMPPEVLEALAAPPQHHRTPEYRALFAEVLKGLKTVFLTQQPVFTLTSTGSGAMEAAIVNCLSPGDSILVVVSGKFGQRWAEIAKAYGVSVTELQVAWGSSVGMDQLSQALKEKPYKAVLTQACETSTGVLHPMNEFAQTVKKISPSTLLMVDAITAIGATELPMDEWKLDVVVAGSQKAFMMPTGLSFIALSENAWKAYAQAKLPRFYWDLGQEKKANEKDESFFSSPVSHMRALQAALKRMGGTNLKATIKRCETLAKAYREMAAVFNLEIFSKAPSSAVTPIQLPAAINSEKLRDWIEKEKSITVMGGQDHLKGKIIRVGSLGYVQDKDALDFAEALADGLNAMQAGSVTPEQRKSAREKMTKILSTAPVVGG